MQTEDQWKICGTCKKPIGYGVTHFICSVSSCNGARFTPKFCTLGCWDAHVPVMNHRSAWAEEKRSPDRPVGEVNLPRHGGDSDELRARLGRHMVAEARGPESKDILIVGSKLKKYIKDRAGMNTSGEVLEMLSDLVRHHCNDAIDQARADSRKTVKARDFSKR